jgi:ketosteroid isomerase-like protein
MNDDALTVMHRWFATWNCGDLDAFMDLYAVDAQMVPPPTWVETGPLEGRTAIRVFFEGLKQAWEGEDTATLQELISIGDDRVSRMDWKVRGRASGIDTHLAVTNVNTIVHGKIVRQRHYLDHAEALRAAGLEE